MDPEQVYQEVLQEEQKKGSSAAVAEARAKAARQRAHEGSPHPKEAKWWPGSQPQFEGGAPAAPAEEPEAVAEPAEEMPAAEAAEPAPEAPAAAAPDQNEPVEVDQSPAGVPPAVPVDQAPASQPGQEPAVAAAVAQGPSSIAPAARPAGVTHGTTSGTRLRPEDETATEAQFTGQQAMYQRRKLIDDLLATGVPEVTAHETGRPRAPMLALLYLLIPLLAIGYLASADGSASSEEAVHEDGGGEGGGTDGGVVSIVASGVAFDIDTMTFAAGEPATIEFDNQDQAPHNVAIYETEADASAQENAIFDGQEITATQVTYEFDAPEAGEYLFQCDVHPSMNGTVTVE